MNKCINALIPCDTEWSIKTSVLLKKIALFWKFVNEEPEDKGVVNLRPFMGFFSFSSGEKSQWVKNPFIFSLTNQDHHWCHSIASQWCSCDCSITLNQIMTLSVTTRRFFNTIFCSLSTFPSIVNALGRPERAPSLTSPLTFWKS